LAAQECDPAVWVSNGSYFQNLDSATCPPELIASQDTYTRFIDSFNGSQAWFYEYRVSTTGSRDDIIFVGPAHQVVFNGFGESYHTVIASDQVRWTPDPSVPWVFFDLEPGIPHTFRLELENSVPPSYRWFIDGAVADEGIAEDFFPSADARMNFRGLSQVAPTFNEWQYIRWGDIPEVASADFNSDDIIDEFDSFYIAECIDRGAAGESAQPSCLWCDMNADNVVDCLDWEIIETQFWTGPTEPPPIPPCEFAIPAVSQWGVAVLVLLILSMGTITYQNRSMSKSGG